MPLLSIQISNNNLKSSKDFIKELSSEIAILTQKPESYVMIMLHTDVELLFSGSDDPCCFAELKSIGSLQPKLLSEKLTALISKYTAIPSNRIYLNFEDIKGSNWGFNGSTFG